MTHNSGKVIEKDLDIWPLESLVNHERIMRLEEVLAKYPDILLSYQEGKDIYPKDLIMDAYAFEKPLTSIEIDDIKSKKVLQLIKDLEEFFFVRYTSYEIYISRFKSLCNVAIDKPRNKIGLSDEFADLAGILYGYSPKEVVQYCLKRRKYHLIK